MKNRAATVAVKCQTLFRFAQSFSYIISCLAEDVRKGTDTRMRWRIGTERNKQKERESKEMTDRTEKMSRNSICYGQLNVQRAQL